MKKLTALFTLCFFALMAKSQTVPSPEQFLGYALGSHFTPHFKIVHYFQEVAKAAPSMVRLEQYGETYEGRPLLLAYVGLPENIQRLESIRVNNLRLAGMAPDKEPGDENTPAIVWLSYNVHGNEAASSEAAMKTLFELVNPANEKTRQWLSHLVVILDPCINPDGRDRYVNWYNSVVGYQPNPDPQAREHAEPWPGGRSNHYNFDLNRDWAWQTQVETQQRLNKYNQWLPQVHVDYHEQGFNAPYYFAPAAEPFHEVITPWQRDFQKLIGQNNASYFDANGWLYFTKERFDLFYPSYGDTYPMYNGAIGMTFEQGGIRAGLAVINRSGDTLTLTDRMMHHFTTGMSTIEVSAQNQQRLIREFHQYFNLAKTGLPSEFKSYYIRSDHGSKTEALKSFLERNRIDWGYAETGNLTGYNYFQGRQENFTADRADLVINSNQPKANLIKVLFEKNSKISDSVTYDITAWSVPFVYGLQVYGCNSFLPTRQEKKVEPAAAASTTYGYAIPWSGMGSARLLASLLKKGVRVRYAEQAFETKGKKFDRGTLLILKTSNKAMGAELWQTVIESARAAGETLYAISSGFVDKGRDFGSDEVHLIHKPVVALLTGTGVSSSSSGEIWHFFEQQLDYPITLVNAEDFGRLSLKNIDVLLMPDGNYRFLSEKGQADILKNWIQQGGRLVALENAVGQLAKADFGIRIKEEGSEKKDTSRNRDKKEDYTSLRKYENRERDDLARSTPGAIYKVELDESHPLAFGYPGYFYSLRLNDQMFEFLKEGGWNVGVLKKDNYISGFAGNKAKEKMKDGLVFGVQDMGRGNIVYITDDVIFRNFWENGKLLLCNAVFMVGQ